MKLEGHLRDKRCMFTGALLIHGQDFRGKFPPPPAEETASTGKGHQRCSMFPLTISTRYLEERRASRWRYARKNHGHLFVGYLGDVVVNVLLPYICDVSYLRLDTKESGSTGVPTT